MSRSGFSLVEVLVATVLLSIAAVGLTSAWRLIDYQVVLARIDRRADRILRQYYEFWRFARNVPPPVPASGTLYQPRASAFATNPSTSQSAGISYSLAADPTHVALSYLVPPIVPSETPRLVTKTISLTGSPAPSP